jgi:hypothetical protein
MRHRSFVARSVALAVLAAGALGLAASEAAATPILMPTVKKELRMQHAIWEKHVAIYKRTHRTHARRHARHSRALVFHRAAIQPPAPPCPENGMLPSPLSNCGIPEAPATGAPFPGNMAYWGGHVQVDPKVYIVYWGWGEKGAFPAAQTCKAETLTEGTIKAKLACDPDSAGKYMADFVSQMGGTQWAGVQTQYYETLKDSAGQTYDEHIHNNASVLGGIWADDTNDITKIGKTSASAPGGTSANTYTDLAAEAARAVAHFGITDLANTDIVVAQPANYSDPNALSTGYCAFHDYTVPVLFGGIYNGIKQGISYTNMPYALSINSSGINVCGENAVNTTAAGKLDGFSIVLGHEIEETITDPGAEDILGSGLSTTNLGGWYDAVDANENGDKCAWVGENPATLVGPPLPVPGALGDIKGNRSSTFAVQSLWSNNAAEGAGYCAGAGTDLPQPVPPV